MTDAAARPPRCAGSPRPRRLRRRIAGRKLRCWLTDILLLGLGITSVVFEPFSIALHSMIGLAFVAFAGPHLWDRRRWISRTLNGIRRRRRVGARQRLSLGQAVLLVALTAVVTVSGLWDWLGTPTRIRYHAISGVILIGVAAWHAWTRRRALVRFRGLVRRRAAPFRPRRRPG